MPFSTYDRDNDQNSSNCAERFKGAWWHNSCYGSNLNGLYLPGQNEVENAIWYYFNNDHVGLKYIEMKMEQINVCLQKKEYNLRPKTSNRITT